MGKGLSLPFKTSDLHHDDLISCRPHLTPAFKSLYLQEAAGVRKGAPASTGTSWDSWESVFLSVCSLPSSLPISCIIVSLGLSPGCPQFCAEEGPEAGRTGLRSKGVRVRTPTQAVPLCLWASKQLVIGVCRVKMGVMQS